MATESDPGKRHVYGPREIGALVPALTRPAFRKRAPASAQVLADWDAIVGPSLARTTTPRRLSGNMLTLACAGPVAMELQHMSGELMARINAHLGRVVVERLRFVQDVPSAAPDSAASDSAAPELPRSPIELPGVPDGPVRDALQALGQAVQRARR